MLEDVAPALDFRLLGLLSQDPLASHASLGRSLGLTGEAVRKRLLRLESDGVVRGFSAIPVAEVFDRTAVGCAFETDLSLADLLGLDDAVWAANSVDGLSGAMGYSQEPQRFVEQARRLAGIKEIEAAGLPGAKPVPPLGPLEWRVMRAMIEEPRASLSSLAEATGLTYRTVRSRRDWLIQTGALVVQPLLRPSKSGGLYYHVWVSMAPGANENEIRKSLGETVLVDRYREPEALYLFCHAHDLGTQARVVKALKQRDDVVSVHQVLNEKFQVATKRLVAWVDEQEAALRSR